jgi:hypothetical protein
MAHFIQDKGIGPGMAEDTLKRPPAEKVNGQLAT